MASGWGAAGFGPGGFPGFEFGRTDAVAGEISLVDAGEGFLCRGDKLLAVAIDHGIFGPLAQVGDGLAADRASPWRSTKPASRSRVSRFRAVRRGRRGAKNTS